MVKGKTVKRKTPSGRMETSKKAVRPKQPKGVYNAKTKKPKARSHQP